MSDISLIKRFIDGNDADSGILYQNYVNSLYGYGMSLGFSGETCMDAIHDVFCKLYHLKNEDIIKIENVKHYLFQSLKNRLFDIYRKDKYKENITLDLPFKTDISVIDTMIEEEDRTIMIKKVESLMNCLTDRQKEAIYLRYIQEMNYNEIGLLLRMTPKSARMLVFRGIEKMRAFTSEEKNIFLILLFFYLFRNF
ncbi:sigma-70 family RNA polymerase sigma factor [Dysgonomonas sp. 521]|uniref:RNA polymerase sigma factor n=1 Tax=Dysgonomonas sp. 521 TaxID=2302932 RepID=UPI0013D26D4C|nr:sigma-70 family RNA polymerase sigma factor [Dysgonomonas sp. 521]NDV93966.1 sigma-70 family RNA polymerase sigma factor [Dysgonomonas sp. 521]